MDLNRFRQHYDAGLITEESFKKVTLTESTRHFSIHWELRSLLYLGILLVSGGLGVLVYKNINTIGHDVIIGLIALACAGCFYYASKKKRPFAWTKVDAPDSLFDYIVLLACLLLITLVAYVQFQYSLFGTHYGLAVFVPMALLFACAYYFDHLGILSMAITNLAAWVGIALTPLTILQANAFQDSFFIVKALALSVALILAGWASRVLQRKAHFSFTYHNFGAHLFFISTYAGLLLPDDSFPIWWLMMMGGAYYFYRLAFKDHSFYFLVVLALYGYLGTSTFLIRSIIALQPSGDMVWVYGGILYFIASACGLIFLLIHWHKKLKAHAHL
ncbi:Predicted membrane protein [Chitinophaga costaii]|uniref:Predicted membrane protein n=1 Tax=Chitinophaga costaii TaxID=1335309 RepID=A0A1C3ZL13_9BACT|nr:DUF2157 domain-containing protein [Chitinophaga costaii]PUZ30419.1 DUF2157 domain-containing protein [Chitinophaga costaii]SCB83031.1 Predicted membrane protein [Chitinophaga costaii]